MFTGKRPHLYGSKKKFHFFSFLFGEDRPVFSCQEERPYFWETEILSFLIIQIISYASVIILGKLPFSNTSKKLNIFFGASGTSLNDVRATD